VELIFLVLCRHQWCGITLLVGLQFHTPHGTAPRQTLPVRESRGSGGEGGNGENLHLCWTPRWLSVPPARAQESTAAQPPVSPEVDAYLLIVRTNLARVKADAQLCCIREILQVLGEVCELIFDKMISQSRSLQNYVKCKTLFLFTNNMLSIDFFYLSFSILQHSVTKLLCFNLCKCVCLCIYVNICFFSVYLLLLNVKPSF